MHQRPRRNIQIWMCIIWKGISFMQFELFGRVLKNLWYYLGELCIYPFGKCFFLYWIVLIYGTKTTSASKVWTQKKFNQYDNNSEGLSLLYLRQNVKRSVGFVKQMKDLPSYSSLPIPCHLCTCTHSFVHRAGQRLMHWHSRFFFLKPVMQSLSTSFINWF